MTPGINNTFDKAIEAFRRWEIEIIQKHPSRYIQLAPIIIDAEIMIGGFPRTLGGAVALAVYIASLPQRVFQITSTNKLKTGGFVHEFKLEDYRNET